MESKGRRHYPAGSSRGARVYGPDMLHTFQAPEPSEPPADEGPVLKVHSRFKDRDGEVAWKTMLTWEFSGRVVYLDGKLTKREALKRARKQEAAK